MTDDYRDFPPGARPKKATKPMSPTARSMALMRKRGAMVAVVERWVPHINSRVDLYSCIDLLCVESRLQGCTGVQATTRSNQASRLKKFRDPKVAVKIRRWLEAGNRLLLHGWSRRVAKTKTGAVNRRKLWGVTERSIVKEDL